jgi:hypothetical protein
MRALLILLHNGPHTTPLLVLCVLCFFDSFPSLSFAFPFLIAHSIIQHQLIGSPSSFSSFSSLSPPFIFTISTICELDIDNHSARPQSPPNLLGNPPTKETGHHLFLCCPCYLNPLFLLFYILDTSFTRAFALLFDFVPGPGLQEQHLEPHERTQLVLITYNRHVTRQHQLWTRLQPYPCS